MKQSQQTDETTRRTVLGLAGGTVLSLLAGTAGANGSGLSGAAGAHAASAFDGSGGVRLEQIGRYEGQDLFDEGGAEIVAYHAPTDRLFVINANIGGVEVLDIADPTDPTPVANSPIDAVGALDAVGSANSVATSEELVAVALEATVPQDPGLVGFYDPETLEFLGTVPVGPLPDKVTFTPDGDRVLVANEGEPTENYAYDPQGSVSIVNLAEQEYEEENEQEYEEENEQEYEEENEQEYEEENEQEYEEENEQEYEEENENKGVTDATVETAGFRRFNGREDQLRRQGIRIFGPNASASQDFEPEYVTISDDSRTAWVSLQENNAIAEIDIRQARVTRLLPLGFKDFSLAGNELDASNADGGVNIRNWPINGILQPDAIGAYSPNGQTYIVTANEGDSRDYDSFSEEVEVSELRLDPDAFDFDEIEGVDSVEELQAPENLGNKNATTTLGDVDGDGLYEELYVFGGRSFSIFTTNGKLVFDSGSDFEEITANRFGAEFNNDNTENTGDSRSDNKGPEPEGLALGQVGDRHYAFIGLERVGGVMVYDITDPEDATFVDYVNNRDFDFNIQGEIANGDAPASAAGDLGPEGLDFATAEESPIDDPLVFVGHEISGTTAVFRVSSESAENDDTERDDHEERGHGDNNRN